jgi:hypothetical protein
MAAGEPDQIIIEKGQTILKVWNDSDQRNWIDSIAKSPLAIEASANGAFIRMQRCPYFFISSNASEA